MQPVELGPRGTVVSGTSVEHPAPGSLVPVPYAIVAVAFEGGISILGAMPGRVDVPLGSEVEVVATRLGQSWGYTYAYLKDPTTRSLT